MVNLIIAEQIYYANKDAFVNEYIKLKLKWNKGKSGWYSKDGTSYLLKIPAESGYKRFETANCDGMEKFLRGIGAKEKKEDLEIKQVEEIKYEPFIGADLDSHRRFHKLLDTMPPNWGVIWTEKDVKNKKRNEDEDVMSNTCMW